MDLRELLGKLDIIEGTMKGAEHEPTGPKFTGYWKGTDSGTPGDKMVGGSTEEQDESVQPSMLKDLKNMVKERAKIRELEEEYKAFLDKLEEEHLGVHPKRPARQGSRPAREYTKHGQASNRYKLIKNQEVDEDGMGGASAIGTNSAGGQQNQLDISKMTPQQKQDLVKKLDPNAMKKAMAGASQMKVASGSSATPQDLMRALDAADKGKAVGPKEMTALKPIMNIVKGIAGDPQAASQLKTLAQKVKTN